MVYSNVEAERSEIREITPMMAEMILRTKAENRTVRKTTVARYAKAMLSGDWMTTHQGIAIDASGRLIDGQHRLEAIVKAGIAIKIMVTYYKGDTTAMMVPFDINLVRTASDITNISKANVSVLVNLCKIKTGFSNYSAADIIRMKEALGEKFNYLHSFTSTHTTLLTAPMITGYYVAFLDGVDTIGQIKAIQSSDFDAMTEGTKCLYKYIVKRATQKYQKTDRFNYNEKKMILAKSYRAAMGFTTLSISEAREVKTLGAMRDIINTYGE